MLETNNTVHSFLENLLVGMEMDSFFFVPSYFELYFSMNRSSTDELPAYIMLMFSDFWWFGEKETWEGRVKNSGIGALDPDVTLQAAELSALCMSANKTIISVKLEHDSVKIFFDNGSCITSVIPEDDYDLFYLRVSDDNREKRSDLKIWFEASHEGLFIEILKKQ